MNVDDLRAPVAAYLAKCVRTDAGCLVNPRITTGHYGEIRLSSKRMAAHRAVAAVMAGRMPAPDEVARHSCDNKPCAEPAHIILGTQSQNIGDVYERDRRPPGSWPRGESRAQAQLTEDIVCQMRARARAGASLGSIVAEFGFHYSPTRMAIRGESWSHVTAEPPVAGRTNRKPNPHAYRFTRAEDAARAAALAAQGHSLAEVGRLMGVSRATAWKLTQVARASANAVQLADTG